MASPPRTSRISQSSSILTRHREQQEAEPTENEAFIPDETEAFPSSKDEHEHPSISPKKEIAHNPVSPKNAMSEFITSIVGGFVAGVALAISHHVFLAFLNGRNIDEYPQYWVKTANNGFSTLFSICIAFVAASALIQMKWNAAGSKPLSIRTIDNLFALPSPVALFTTVTSTQLRPLRPFLLPILTAVFIQSLALVSVLAPNALTVARSAEISRDVLVPTLDLSKGPIMSIVNYDFVYTPSPLWTTILTSIMLQPPLANWKIPAGCGAACTFDLEYDGPGLQCTDTPLEPPPYTGLHEYPLVYNATSTLYPIPRASGLSFWETLHPYELRIGYIATDVYGINTWRDGGSVHCVFRNATYKASFQVENNTMEVNHVIQYHGDILGTVNYGNSDSECSEHMFGPCYINGLNTRAMCEIFASPFTGKIQYNDSDPAHITETAGLINEGVIDLLFRHEPDSMKLGFQLAVSNLSESLVSLFSNLILGSIPHRNDTTTVRAELWDGVYAWSYTVWILWAVYLPTLLLASLVILNGLLSIRSNKQRMDDKFSNFLLATKDIDLDVVCIDAADFEELQQLRLLYQREKGGFSVVSAPSKGMVVGKM